MQLKIRNLKFISSLLIVCVWATLSTQAQEIIEDTAEAKTVVTDTVKKKMKPFRLDGVAAVIGDYVILESEVDITLEQFRAQSENVTRCQTIGQLMETKLATHHAVQDSLSVPDARIYDEVNQTIQRIAAELGGTEDDVREYYKKESIAEVRDEIFKVRKELILSNLMNEKIIENIDVTPDEVRTFFKKIPEDELPTIGVELEIAQIVITPKASEESRQKAIDELNSYRNDIIENGSSFATKAVLYTDDTGSRAEGGFMRINRKSPLVKEFRDVVFGLQIGQISEPFETEYGYHIATLDKVRGDDLEIRHILVIPEIGKKEEEEAKDKIELIRKRIVDGELDFAEAAKEFSDQKETKFDGGILINPNTLDKRFELNKLDPTLYAKVNNLKDNETSLVFNDPDRTGKTHFKILTVNNRYEEHKADFVKDYVKIKELALREKQINAVKEWRDEKIIDTYIKINGENKDCEFISNWIKK